MSDLTEDQLANAEVALGKMREGLAEFLQAVADPGEPEIPLNALVLFEAQGMAEEGLFYRRQYLALESNGSATQMLGMFELLAEKIQHDIRCASEHI